MKNFMDTKKSLKSIFNTIALMMMVIVFSSMQCSPRHTEIGFIIQKHNSMNDTIKVEFADHSGFRKSFSLPYFNSQIGTELPHKRIHWDYLNDELNDDNPIDDLSWDEAMRLLKDNVANVKITRKSDNKSISYRHEENATEQEKFFFTKDAWVITDDESYDDEGLVRRDYTFFVTDELFE